MKIIFVYNARKGFMHGMMDTVHKTVSPDTYSCDLCAITYGAFSMNKDWRGYLTTLPLETEFRYKKDFNEAYPGNGIALPAILLDKDGKLSPLVSAEAFKQVKDVNQLASTLDAALVEAGAK
jgi:hypothetical protein